MRYWGLNLGEFKLLDYLSSTWVILFSCSLSLLPPLLFLYFPFLLLFSSFTSISPSSLSPFPHSPLLLIHCYSSSFYLPSLLSNLPTLPLLCLLLFMFLFLPSYFISNFYSTFLYPIISPPYHLPLLLPASPLLVLLLLLLVLLTLFLLPSF